MVNLYAVVVNFNFLLFLTKALHVDESDYEIVSHFFPFFQQFNYILF